MVSVVVPVFRGIESLEIIYLRLQKVLDVFEVIYVYDCGNFVSWKEIEKLTKQYSNCFGIKLSRNFGQHNATICGFSYCRGDVIITIDEDLQHDPFEIPNLLKIFNNRGLDVLYGIYEDRNHSIFRNFTSGFLKKLLKYGIPELHKDYSSFRIIKAEIAYHTLEMKNSYTFLDGYLTWITSNVGSAKIKHYESFSRKSSYSLQRLIEHSINIFVTFSSLPIRIVTIFSFLFFSFGTIYGLYIILSALTFADYNAGFPTLVSLLSIGFGSVLLGIGVIGEYIQRINLKTTNRPIFVVEKTTKEDDSLQ